MTIQLPAPLPECAKCGRPTRRAVHGNTGGLCTACAAWDHSVAVVGPEEALAAREQLQDWQDTVRRIRRAEAIKAAERASRLRAQRRRRVQ